MPKTLAIIQCRLGSSRLPRKALMDIGGKPLIQHVLERVRAMRGIYVVAIASPPQDRDDINASLWREGGGDVPVRLHAYRIPDEDVLQRFALVADEYSACDAIMRVTADCPLWNPAEGERVLRAFRETGASYVTNAMEGYYTDGEDVEVFSADALRAANIYATDPYDREHVGPFMERTYPSYVSLPTGARVSSKKTSVDTSEDLERVRAMVEGRELVFPASASSLEYARPRMQPVEE